MFNEVTNVWLFFAAGFLLCFVIQMIGYAIYRSQLEAEDVDTRIKLNVYTFQPDGSYGCEVTPVRDQDDAQRVLNQYVFSAIRSAHVTDPLTGATLAKMDKYGRLIGV